MHTYKIYRMDLLLYFRKLQGNRQFNSFDLPDFRNTTSAVHWLVTKIICWVHELWLVQWNMTIKPLHPGRLVLKMCKTPYADMTILQIYISLVFKEYWVFIIPQIRTDFNPHSAHVHITNLSTTIWPGFFYLCSVNYITLHRQNIRL